MDDSRTGEALYVIWPLDIFIHSMWSKVTLAPGGTSVRVGQSLLRCGTRARLHNNSRLYSKVKKMSWNSLEKIWSKPRKVSFTIASNLSHIRTYYCQNTKPWRYRFNNVNRPSPLGLQPYHPFGSQSGLDVLMKTESEIKFQPRRSER